MRAIRKFAMVAVAAALMCALVAASASAVQLKAGTTALSVGSSVHGATTSGAPATLSGTFFGIPVNVTCDSTMDGTVLANASTAGNAWGSIDSLAFNNCHGINGQACVVNVNGLRWTPYTSANNGNQGGLEATSTTNVNMATGTGNIDVSNCVGGSAGSCELQGGTTTALTDGSFSLVNYLSATWTNGAAEQLSINSTNIRQITSGCFSTNPKWVGSYRVTNASGVALTLG